MCVRVCVCWGVLDSQMPTGATCIFVNVFFTAGHRVRFDTPASSCGHGHQSHKYCLVRLNISLCACAQSLLARAHSFGLVTGDHCSWTAQLIIDDT